MDRKPIFDAVRRLLGRGFRPSEVAALDAALDSALRPDDPDPSEAPFAVSAAGVALVKRFEGCARRRSDGLFEATPTRAAAARRGRSAGGRQGQA